jgi:hypothetical protein
MGFASIFYNVWQKVQADARRDAAFNAHWKRLTSIQSDLSQLMLKPILVVEVYSRFTATERSRLMAHIDEVLGLSNAIADNINVTKNADLSRYATALKRLATHALKLCAKYGVVLEVTSVEYVACRKTLVVNGRDTYFFG